MMSTAARYPIKPKTLTLLELSQSISDFRHPPPSVSSYQFQASSNTAQILTRRLYLHPLTINSSLKQPSLKSFTTSATDVTSTDNEQRSQINIDKNRDIKHKKHKSSHHGLAILSTSFPLTTRIISKPDARHSRDKISIHTDNDTNSEYDASITSISLNQASLPPITRGTTSSTHTVCTRPSCVINRRKTFTKPTRLEKVNVWNHLNRTLQRPIPMDPPTTPLGNVSDFTIEYDRPHNQYFNSNTIQEIKIYKRYPIHNQFIDDDNDYDNYIHNQH